METAVDTKLRDQLATDFHKDRSCNAGTRMKLFRLRNFIDCGKAFDSVDRDTLWQVMRPYSIPEKFISLIKTIYQGILCRVVHGGQLSEKFEVTADVRQGCLLSPFLFLLVIDWIMKTITKGRKNDIQWSPGVQSNDLDFADNLASLYTNQRQMQDKTTQLATNSAKASLQISKKKTKLQKTNTTCYTPILLEEEPIAEVESFKYLGSIIANNREMRTKKC